VARGLNEYGRRLVLPGARFNEGSDSVNAGFLISLSTGTNGAQAAGQPAADASKAEDHSDEASFGQVLTQVGEQAAGSTEPAEAVAPTTESSDSPAALSPLQIVLALQASALAVVQAGQGGAEHAGDGQSTTAHVEGSPVMTTGSVAVLSHLSGQAGAAMQAGAEGPLPSDSVSVAGGGSVLDGIVQTGLPGGLPSVDQGDATGTNQPESNGQAGMTAQGDLRKTVAPGPSDPSSDSFAEQIQDRPAADRATQDRTGNRGPAGEHTGPAEVSAALAARVEAGQPDRDAGPLTTAAPAFSRHGAAAKAETMAEANSNAGEPIQASSELNAALNAAAPSSQTGLQDRAMNEQARQLAASGQADKSKESGKGQKEPQSSQSVTGAERFGIGMGDGRTGRIDGAAKVVAAAPVAALPTEPAGVPSVQSLHLEVERPDLGGVQVRVVLADQTVHAKVTTGQVEVRDFLVARQDQLAVGLKASGLEMGEFQVDVDPQGRGQSGPGWFAGAQGDQADQGRRQPEPPVTQPLFVESRTEQWSGYGHGTPGGVLERRTLNVFA
jgi:hypothetical protein